VGDPLGVFKRILFWSYGRTSWQYDLLSVAILAFVFLTPPAWFRTGERNAPAAHQNAGLTIRKLVILPENLPANPGTADFERRARAETGRGGARVTGWRILRDEAGRAAAYEVDIE
jgi:hypothetical protein